MYLVILYLLFHVSYQFIYLNIFCASIQIPCYVVSCYKFVMAI